jgi:hypothetical protein
MTRYLFIGEQPSYMAHRNGWTWRSGRLAAIPLFAALGYCGISLDQCRFISLLSRGAPDKATITERVWRIRKAKQAGAILVALGKKVSRELVKHEIQHLPMRHPAARGRLRRRDLYVEHVRECLGGKADAHIPN